MKKSGFFYNFFISLGILWFLCSLIVLIFQLQLREKEMLLVLVLPLAYAIVRQFTASKTTDSAQENNVQQKD